MRGTTLAEWIGIAAVALAAGPAQATNHQWNTDNGAFTSQFNWTPSGVPGAVDMAIFRRGNVPQYLVIFGELLVPSSTVHATVDRLRVGTNPMVLLGLHGSTLTIDSTDTSETGRGLVVGDLATDVAVLGNTMANLTTLFATVGSAAGSSGTLNVNGGPFSVTGTGANYALIVGLGGTGIINVTNGKVMTVTRNTILGRNPGSSGTITVSGANSTWNNNASLSIGDVGVGTVHVLDGGRVNANSFAGTTIISEFDGQGTLLVSGANSIFTTPSELDVWAPGHVEVAAGGQISSGSGGLRAGTTGSIHSDGATATWTNAGDLDIGGVLQISSGGHLSSGNCTVAHVASGPSVLVSGAGASCTISGELNLGGLLGGASLHISGGGQATSSDSNIAYAGGTNALASVDGPGSAWTAGVLRVGENGTGLLDITGGAVVNASIINIGYGEDAIGPILVQGEDSILHNTGVMIAGWLGLGNIEVRDGAHVDGSMLLGYMAGSLGQVLIQGAGSSWTGSSAYVGYIAGQGTLEITDGGQLNSFSGRIGFGNDASGSVIVDGPLSTWAITSTLEIASNGEGSLTLVDGGTVNVGTQTTIGLDGQLGGDGVMVGHVQNSGVVSPGASAGVLQINGDYTQLSGGRLDIELGGTTPGALFDRLSVNGDVALDGTLTVNLIGGFAPASGQSFAILTADHVDGTFATVNLPPGTDISYAPTAVIITTFDACAAADLNCDGVVNSLDLGILLSSWSIPPSAPACSGTIPCPADINGDGVVNTLDLGMLLSSWTL